MSRKQDHPTKVTDIMNATHRRKPQWKPTRHLILLPLEPMAERYTQQWLDWFREELDRLGLEYTMFAPSEEERHIDVGTVLDSPGTTIWKSQQMIQAAEFFKNGHKDLKDITVFTMDAQHPGIEAIKYMAHMYNTPCRIFGFLHASSYTTEDFASGMAPWMRHFEYAWFNLFDGLFVGSLYHKNKAIAAVSRVPWEFMDKFEVVRAPFMVEPLDDNVLQSDRPIDVIWPHRFDREKRPNTALSLFRQMKEGNPRYRFAFCTSRQVAGDVIDTVEVSYGKPAAVVKLKNVKFNTNDETMLGMLNQAIDDGIVEFYHCPRKDDYYGLLLRSRVMLSTTIEENFGYCFVEAVHHGCYPVVPDGFSYPEFITDEIDWITNGVEKPQPQAYLFGLHQDIRGTLTSLISDGPGGVEVRESFQVLLRHCRKAIEYMVDSMFAKDEQEQQSDKVTR